MKLHFSQAWNNITNFSCGYVGILILNFELVENIGTHVIQGVKYEFTLFAGMEQHYELLMWICGNFDT